MGADLMLAIEQVDGIILDRILEASTALVQGAIRAAGYSPPSTQDPSTVEELLKLATLGQAWPLLAAIPEVSLPLPEGWDKHAATLAFQGLQSGTLKPAADPGKIGAVGGWAASDHTTASTGYPQRASRSQLRGY
jgi:hypothetical protein